MTIQEAIEKAIEGGYKGGHIWNVKGDFYVLRNENGNGYEHLSYMKCSSTIISGNVSVRHWGGED